MIVIKLRALLEEQKMSQSELARLANIRPSTISDLCNNNSNFLKLEHLEKICKILNCKIEEMIEIIEK